MKMVRHFGLIGAPTSAGAFAPGQEKAPRALRAAGLVRALEDRGAKVSDFGDLAEWRWRPDRQNPRAMNTDAVVLIAREVADRCDAALKAGATPLVIGGDCTLEVGTMLGASRNLDPLRLVYFDPHPDLNLPSTVPDGALDWMGVAHMLDLPGAVPKLANLGPTPLLLPRNLSLLSHSKGRSQPAELEAIERLKIHTVAERQVAENPKGSATRALAPLGGGKKPFLVHFDVDAIDMTDLPLAENTNRNVGLTLDQATEALAALTSAKGFSALTVTEANPDHAPDSETIERFVGALVSAIT